MTTLDYVRELENDQEDERRHERELQEAAEIAYERDDEEDYWENVSWAIKHGLLNPNGPPIHRENGHRNRMASV